jgi:hypothetical protein
LPNGALTRHPSAACQLQSSPTAPSYSCKSTAQARSSAPFATHSVKRSWTVLLGPKARGSAAHWEPVRAIQIRPSKIARSSRRGRPGFLRGLVQIRSGASSVHSASSTCQMVGSSFAGAASAATCSVFMHRGYHSTRLSG